MTSAEVSRVLETEFLHLDDSLKPELLMLCLSFWHRGYAKGCDDMGDKLKTAFELSSKRS